LWGAIRAMPAPLYLLVGQRDGAQAHLFGSFAVDRQDGEDLIVLEGTPIHVHVNWPAVTRVERGQRDGYDCLSFLGQQTAVFELLAGPGSTFQPEVLALVAEFNRG
jgi:hypothetical protein